VGGVTPVVSTEGSKQLEITLTDNMVGMLLQFGFATTVANAGPSGMYYDNVLFEAIANGGDNGGGDNGGGDNGGGDNGGDTGPSGGTGYGVAALNTDGVLVSGNRFTDGASAWVAATGSDLGVVTGWSIVDNNFGPSTGIVDVNLGAGTSGVVVGRSQSNPRVADDGSSNDVLEGTNVSANSDLIAADISATFDSLWTLLTGN